MIKAYAAHEPRGKLEAFEYDPGALQAHEVEIDVQFCGICHSDLSVIDDEWGMTQYPVVAGHEVVGTISKIGEQVKHLKVGQAVGLGWHAGYCNTCEPCHSGDHNLCASAQATIIGHHGGFADKLRFKADLGSQGDVKIRGTTGALKPEWQRARCSDRGLDLGTRNQAIEHHVRSAQMTSSSSSV